MKKARENPVIRPTGRCKKRREAQLKNYITGIDWQIDALKQVIAKRELEKRQREIVGIYSKNQDDKPGE